MAIMLATRTLRKNPAGEPTGIMAPAGARLDILDEKAPPWMQVKLIDLDGQPEGWVSFESVSKDLTKPPPLDKVLFARECSRHATYYDLRAHYVVAIAELRTRITDINEPDRIGPFALSTAEWEAFRALPEFSLGVSAADITQWRMQCAVFSVRSSVIQTKLRGLLAVDPSPTEIYLSQLIGTKAVTRALHFPTETVGAIVAATAADDFAIEGLDKTTAIARTAGLLNAALTAEGAIEAVAKAVQSALDETRTLVLQAGADVVKDARSFAGVSPNSNGTRINFDAKPIPADRKQWAELISTMFADVGYGLVQQTAAIANAIAESNLRPTAASPPPEPSFGLFQLNQNGVGAGFSAATLKDPRRNIEIMLSHIAKSAKQAAFAGTTSLKEAVSIFVYHFERPANMAQKSAERFEIARALLV